MTVADNSAKVVLLGDSGVGKSSLALRFTRNEFRPYCESTIGASFSTKIVEIPRDLDDQNAAQKGEKEPQQSECKHRKFEFKIWDTAGQEKYASLAPMYYRGAAAAILVYDISNRHSFLVLKDWVQEISSKGPEDIIILLCGNKSDMAQERQVPFKEATEYSKEIGALYVETSARDDSNVEHMFLQLGKRIPDSKINISNVIGDVDLGQSLHGRRGCC